MGAEHTEVKSAHHQGVDVLGEGVVAAGWADDGVVEAIGFRTGSSRSASMAPRGGRAQPGVGALVEEARERCEAAAPRLREPAPRGARMIHVLEPATAEVMAEIPQAGIEETDAAVAGPRRPFPPGAPSPRPTAPPCSAGSRTPSRPTSRTWPGSARNAGKPISDARRDGHGR